MQGNSESVSIYCQDGYQLGGCFYPHAGEFSQKLPILICPATGILQKFYQHFACWLAAQGFDVLTFDFRGIGKSLHGKLKNSQASIQDWGMLDIPAAIDYVLAKTQQTQVILIGHSAGGQLLGVVPNYGKVAKFIGVAASTGYVKKLKGKTKILAPVMFDFIFPISNYFMGYGAIQILGMGENLPKNVANQWRAFCKHAGYIENAIGKTISEDFHSQITIPMTIIYASDDEIATQANVEDLLRLYPQAQKKTIRLEPEAWRHPYIGHMGFFKRSHQNLWQLIRKELDLV
ncbi:alpha/beta fold hydrolase [Acinetobacter sp.]|uniref:alpha/beta hydrolase family protein n=1 Tax=Acinetobacter sp. TaxID=472 RepID=UPI0031D75B87